ncbi:hypothetical protein KY306_02870 [Candidatus Woesearchaeota archaeon]|nr:hypothetical protein [Candidatus Woesearchaeota archaeon]
MKRKKAQLEVGFNWIYILIAGAVILMFFLGIVIRQKVVSEQKLSATVLQKIEGIFTGAGLSEKTVNVVEIPELTLVFTCDNETGYSDYAVKGTGVKSETPWQPVFAPKEVTSKRIVTWTLEWKMPFKVINYLFISAPNIKYYIFSDIYVLPEQFNWKDVTDLSEVRYDGEDQVRLVFFNQQPEVPRALENLPDEKVTAVEFSGNGATFFQKEKYLGVYRFRQIGEAPLIKSFPLEEEFNNANIFAAIFSTDPDEYKCNLRKGFRRLEILLEIYQERTAKINDYYRSLPNQATNPDANCGRIIHENQFENMKTLASDCAQRVELICVGISDWCPFGDTGPCYGEYIAERNIVLNNNDCAVIY